MRAWVLAAIRLEHLGNLAGAGRQVDGEHRVKALLCDPGDRFEVRRRVPQRRIWLLPGSEPGLQVVEGEVLAVEVDTPGGQAGADDLQRLEEHGPGVVLVDAEEVDLRGRGATAQAHLQPSAAHLVE